MWLSVYSKKGITYDDSGVCVECGEWDYINDDSLCRRHSKPMRTIESKFVCRNCSRTLKPSCVSCKQEVDMVLNTGVCLKCTFDLKYTAEELGIRKRSCNSCGKTAFVMKDTGICTSCTRSSFYSKYNSVVCPNCSYANPKTNASCVKCREKIILCKNCDQIKTDTCCKRECLACSAMFTASDREAVICNKCINESDVNKTCAHCSEKSYFAKNNKLRACKDCYKSWIRNFRRYGSLTCYVCHKNEVDIAYSACSQCQSAVGPCSCGDTKLVKDWKCKNHLPF